MTLITFMMSVGAIAIPDQPIQSSREERTYHVEGRAGPFGVGLSMGIMTDADELYLLKFSADNYVQGVAATVGLHYRRLFKGRYYFEPGIGVDAFGTDRKLTDRRGPYAGMAIGRTLTGADNDWQLGIEWTCLSIFYSIDEDALLFRPTFPKFTIATDF